jgi:putative endonuclease
LTIDDRIASTPVPYSDSVIDYSYRSLKQTLVNGAMSDDITSEVSLFRRVKNLFLNRDSGSCQTRKEVGALGEKLAVNLLKGLGYEILQTNYRCRQGEIDIIAKQKECLVFVEVRTKKSVDFGTPEESITPAKRDKLISLANAYLQNLDIPPPLWRIDVVAVELTPEGRVHRLEHIENAVS